LSVQELKAGKQWAERRFVEIAREFGAPRTLTQEDRWRETDKPLMPHSHRMAYYIGLAGHLKRGDLTFRGVDLEIAGAGELASQERLARHIREVLVSLGSGRNPGGKPPHAVTGWL
jgi:hypothetical protein